MRPIFKKVYGPVGLILFIGMELVAILDIALLEIWVTPFAWYGYIFFVDWLVFKRKGSSLILTETKEFFIMLPISILLWCIFELHNLACNNWEYIGIPENVLLALLGYAVSFSTVLPALVETDMLLQSLGIFRLRIPPMNVSRKRLILEITCGLIFIASPTYWPSPYTGPLVWVGYLFVFSPLNYLIGIPSLFKERESGSLTGTLTLFLAGYVCALVWEFLNFWAGAKWIYHVPYFENIKIFEMPLLGFLGFGPFALAFIEMYRFVRHLFLRRVSPKVAATFGGRHQKGQAF